MTEAKEIVDLDRDSLALDQSAKSRISRTVAPQGSHARPLTLCPRMGESALAVDHRGLP